MPIMSRKPLYLFVCAENACRSQMAQGLFNTLTDKAIAESAGTMPAGSVNPMAVKVMKERGIDISSQKPKELTPELTEKAFRVITMGCIDNCPYAPPAKTIEWDIPDPKGKGEKAFESARDQIEAQVIDLLKQESLLL